MMSIRPTGSRQGRTSPRCHGETRSRRRHRAQPHRSRLTLPRDAPGVGHQRLGGLPLVTGKGSTRPQASICSSGMSCAMAMRAWASPRCSRIPSLGICRGASRTSISWYARCLRMKDLSPRATTTTGARRGTTSRVRSSPPCESKPRASQCPAGSPPLPRAGSEPPGMPDAPV